MAGCLKLLGEALAKRPRPEVLYLLRADTLIAAGRGREALADASHLTDLGYDLAASDLRARAYTAMGRPREAAEELRGALAYAPESTYLHLALASALAQAGQTRAALQEIARTIGRDPRSASAYLSLGNVLVTNGGTKAGVRAFRRAVALNPNDPIAANNLAWTLAVLDKSPAEGLKYARQAYQIAPNHPNIVDTLAWTYHLLGQDDKALPLARKAVTLRPVLPNAVEHLATLLRAAGKSAEAEALTRRLAAPVKAGGHTRGNDGIPARPELDMPPPEMLGGQ